MGRRNLVMLLTLLLAAILASWLWWVRPRKVDMANYAPSDTLVYLEAKDPLELVETLARTEALQILGKVSGSPIISPRAHWVQRFVGWTGIGPIQSVILARAQVAVVVTDLGTSQEGDTLRVKPEGAILIETHTSERRIRPPFEQGLRNLAEKAYSRPTSRRITIDGLEYIEWVSPDGSRQIVGTIAGSLIIIGNSERAVQNCVAASQRQRPSLKDDAELRQMRLQLDEAHALTFGYVPSRNSASLLGVGIPLLLGRAPEDSDFQRLIAGGATKVVGGVGWSSRAYLTGIEDRYLITLQPSIINRLKPNFVPSKVRSQMQTVMPNDFYSVTSYRFAEPAAAWQSLKTSVSSQVDALSAIVFSSLLKSALLSYGIDDSEALFGAVNDELLTLRLGEADEHSILIAGVRNRAALRELVIKKFGMKMRDKSAEGLETFADSQEEFAASLFNDFFAIGDAAEVRRYTESRRVGATVLTAEKLRKMTFFALSPGSASIVTYTNDSDRVRRFISVITAFKATQSVPSGHLEDLVATLPYSVTETTLGERGVERTTRSPLGQFSTLLPLLNPEQSVQANNAVEMK